MRAIAKVSLFTGLLWTVAFLIAPSLATSTVAPKAEVLHSTRDATGGRGSIRRPQGFSTERRNAPAQSSRTSKRVTPSAVPDGAPSPCE